MTLSHSYRQFRFQHLAHFKEDLGGVDYSAIEAKTGVKLENERREQAKEDLESVPNSELFEEIENAASAIQESLDLDGDGGENSPEEEACIKYIEDLCKTEANIARIYYELIRTDEGADQKELNEILGMFNEEVDDFIFRMEIFVDKEIMSQDEESAKRCKINILNKYLKVDLGEHALDDFSEQDMKILFEPLPADRKEFEERLNKVFNEDSLEKAVGKMFDRINRNQDANQLKKNKDFIKAWLEASLQEATAAPDHTKFIAEKIGAENIDSLSEGLAKRMRVVELPNGEVVLYDLQEGKAIATPEDLRTTLDEDYNNPRKLKRQNRKMERQANRDKRKRKRLLEDPKVKGAFKIGEIKNLKRLPRNLTLRKALKREEALREILENAMTPEEETPVENQTDGTENNKASEREEKGPSEQSKAEASQMLEARKENYGKSELEALIMAFAELFEMFSDYKVSEKGKEEVAKKLEDPEKNPAEIPGEVEAAQTAYLESLKNKKPTLPELMKVVKNSDHIVEYLDKPAENDTKAQEAYDNVIYYESQRMPALEDYIVANLGENLFGFDSIHADEKGITLKREDGQVQLKEIEQKNGKWIYVFEKEGEVYRQALAKEINGEKMNEASLIPNLLENADLALKALSKKKEEVPE